MHAVLTCSKVTPLPRVEGCTVSVEADAGAWHICWPLDFVRTVASWFVWLQQQAFLSCVAPWGLSCCALYCMCPGTGPTLRGRHLSAHLLLTPAAFAAFKLRCVSGKGQQQPLLAYAAGSSLLTFACVLVAGSLDFLLLLWRVVAFATQPWLPPFAMHPAATCLLRC
jgi:hypothetical protein